MATTLHTHENITKSLVHKVVEENVLIEDLRRLIPLRLEPEIWETVSADPSVGTIFTRWYGEQHTRPDILQIPPKDQRAMAEHLESIGLVPETQEFLGEMRVRVGHRFFFEHDNDHIPGLMLIETFRQFAIACAHVFGKVPSLRAQMILSNLDSAFQNYAELFMSVTFYARVTSTWNKRGYWSDVELNCEAYQQGNVLGVFGMKGKVIPIELYRRMRERRHEALIGSGRFYPRQEREIYAAFIDEKTLNREEIRIHDMSLQGFSATRLKDTAEPPQDQALVCIKFQGQQIVYARCRRTRIDDGNGVAGYQITEISPDDRRILSKGIAVNGILDEDRYFYEIGK